MTEQTMSALEMETNGDEEMDALVPPLEEYTPTALHFWSILKWPLGFIIFNVAAVVGCAAIIEATDVRYGLAVLTALLLMNAVLCYHAVQIVKSEMESLEAGRSSVEDSGDQSQQDPSAVKFATASQQADQFFGPATPKTTFFISFLSVLWALMLATSVGCGSSLLYFHFYPKSWTCWTELMSYYSQNRALPMSNTTLANVPSDVQQYFTHDGEQSHRSFVRLNDGSIFFRGENEVITNTHHSTNAVLFRYFSNGTLESYPDFGHPSQFVQLGDKEQVQGFCFQYGDLWYWRRMKVSCYSQPDGFVKIPVTDSSGGEVIQISLFSRETNNTDDVWIAAWSSHPQKLHHAQSFMLHRIGVTDNATLGITTVQQDTLIGELSLFEDESEYKSCFVGMRWAVLCIFAVVLGCESIFLYRHGISSSLVPSTVGVVALLINTNIICLGELLSLSAVYVLMFALLRPSKAWAKQVIWKFFDQEQIVWVLYSILLTVTIFVPVLSSDPVAGSVLAVASVVPVALILDHPICQLMGVLVGVMAIGAALCSLIFPPAIIFAVAYAIGSCGLTSAGSFMRRYRIHMFVYGRQMCRCFYQFIHKECLKGQSRETTGVH